MKYFVIGVFILCLLVGLCFFAEREIGERSREIAAQLELALSALKAENGEQTQFYLKKAADAWAQSEGILASFISHDHTNGIGEALAGLPWLAGNELGQAIEALLKQVRGLAEMDQIVWKNIL